MKIQLRAVLAVPVVALLAWSFWHHAGWLQLCAGLAIFLFGMQCLEEGLRQLAGSWFEQWLARSTRTPGRALLFGTGGTVLLQSSTLVSLLTIAFIGSGLIQLAGGIAIIFGANLGATTGIWLLALAGHGVSLAPLALPLLVFGVLASFIGPRGKAAGRIVLGVAFIFLGIDQIKSGFEAFGGGLDMTAVHTSGLRGTLLFVAVGLAGTVVLQSSHATLMLTLTALAAGQITLDQSLALAIGSNVGSSVSTGVMGALGGNRSGQRLALAHVLFNATTALLALLLLPALAWVVRMAAGAVGLADNTLLQLALFHTLFNAAGVALFWPGQERLAAALTRWLPERGDAASAATRPTQAPAAAQAPTQQARALHLSDTALESADAAAAAIALELRHLASASMEVVAQTLGLPAPARGRASAPDNAAPTDPAWPDADALYQQRVKGIYGDLLRFMGRMELPLDEEHRNFWTQSQRTAQALVDAVKDAKHLQKNLAFRLQQADSPLREAYAALQRHALIQLQALHALAHAPPDEAAQRQRVLQRLGRQVERFDTAFRQRVFTLVRDGLLDSQQTGSLMIDLGYAGRIHHSLLEALGAAREPRSLRRLRWLAHSPSAPDQAPAATPKR